MSWWSQLIVHCELNSFRRKDQVHLLDFIAIGLVDATWIPTLIPLPAERLQQLLDDPDG